MIVRLTSPSLVSFRPHLMLLSSNSSLFASCGLKAERCIHIVFSLSVVTSNNPVTLQSFSVRCSPIIVVEFCAEHREPLVFVH